MASKELLEGYVGIKYEAVCREAVLPAGCRELHAVFRRCGDRLRQHQMTPANGGNLSQRGAAPGEIVITTAGCNLGQIEPDELAVVCGCSLESQQVTYRGLHEPSSEAMLHWLIYREHPDAGAVLHAHDPLATSTAAAAALRETPREEPYGTLALARLAAETFASGARIIVLKNHGYVALGEDAWRATETVVAMHRELLGAQGT